MLLIGITGAIGHGKSTLADILVDMEPNSVHLESFYLVADIINAWHKATGQLPDPDDIDSLNNWVKLLPPILKKRVGSDCPYEQIKLDPEHMASNPAEYEKLLVYTRSLLKNPKLLKRKITQANKYEYRPILQWVGGYLPKKIDPGIWYEELISRAMQAQKEGKKLCVIGGVRYPTDAEIVRDAGGKVVKIFRPETDQPDLLDPTERERDNIQVDSTVMNDGTLAGLKKCAKKLLVDLAKNNLRPRYSTKGD